jgi:methylisocitrate lyase
MEPIPPSGRRLRELLAQKTVIMPGAFNALTAVQIEAAGFNAVYVSGAAISAARGLPDIGLLSMTEMAAEAGAIARAVRIPALADADTGYGPPLAVMRTVQLFEEAGLAGLQLEDQENPKRCGHLPGKRVVPASEMAQKIAAAVQARRHPEFLIVARTDARSVEGLEAAIQRARTYVRAGADAIFPEALESAEEFRAFAQGLSKAGITVPLVANMTEFGRTPYLTVDEFDSLGYRLVLFPVTALRVAAKAIDDMLADLKRQGTQQDSVARMLTRQQLYDLLQYADYEKRDQELHERYGQSED